MTIVYIEVIGHYLAKGYVNQSQHPLVLIRDNQPVGRGPISLNCFENYYVFTATVRGRIFQRVIL